MARIQAITMHNFKASGRNRHIGLPECAVLTGPNGSGKTQNLQAVKLAITGSLPEANVGSTAGVFKLANNGPGVDEMSVGLVMDNGFSFSRSWIRKTRHDPGTGRTSETVSQDIELAPEREERKLAEKEARIKAECGLDPIMVDVQSFLGMSNDKRRDFFYQLGGAGAVEVEQVTGILTRQSNRMSAHSRKAFDSLIEQAEKRWAQPGNGNLEKLLSWLDERKKAAALDVRRATAATAHLSRVKERQQTVAGDLESLKTDLARARDEKEQLAGEMAKRDALAAAVREREERLGELAGKVAGLKEPGAEKIGGLRKELAGVEAALDKLRNANTIKRKELRAATEKASGLVEETDARLQAAHDELVGLVRQSEAAKAMGELKDRLCESCRKLVGELTDLTERIGAARKAEDEIAAELTGARDRATRAAKAESDFMRESLRAENELGRRLEDIPRRIEDAERAEATRKADLEAAETTLRRMRENKLEEPLPAEQTEARLQGLRTRIGELEERLEAKQEEENEIRLQLEAIAEAQAAETRLYCAKQAIKLLGPSGLKGELVKQTLDPIRYEVNECLRLFGIVGKQFSFRMVDGRGNEVFDFGWNDRSGRFVAFDSLSTGQQTMLLASLVAVICRRSNSPLKLLALDNLEVVSSDNAVAFYNGLPAVAQYCGLDNVLAATSKEIDHPLPKNLVMIRFPLEQETEEEQEAEKRVAEAVNA